MVAIKPLKVVVVEPDGTRRKEEIDQNDQLGLTGLQSLIGGWIEGIGTSGVFTAYLDEEGKLKGKPPNDYATIMAATFGWRGLPGDLCVGTVVFCGPADAEGRDTDVTPRMLALFGL